jgi:peptidoglycan/xylan/chitin deacetylase (PgdA/CDA1 family)
VVVNGPRPRGRAVALAMVVLAMVVTAQALLQGSLIKKAYARPVLVASKVASRSGPTAAPPYRHSSPMPAWEVFPPGAHDAIIPPGRTTVQVPILMYHYIQVPPSYAEDRIGWGLSTSPEDFKQQMDYLDQHGYHPITLTDLRAYLNGSRSMPDRPVVLTFDDGYLDLYTQAFPVLKHHHFKAVAYIVSGFLGRTGTNVSPEQVREMDAYGIEIGAHTANHVDLTRAGSTLNFEVAGSKASLEAVVGHPVLDFCYPSGKFNAQVIQAVQAAGYESATTTQSGAAHSLGDRFVWARVRVSGSESLDDFIKGLQQHETGQAPVSVSPIRIPRAYPLVYDQNLSSLQ